MPEPRTCADLFRQGDMSLRSEQAKEAALCNAAPSHMWHPSPAYVRRFGR